MQHVADRKTGHPQGGGQYGFRGIGGRSLPLRALPQPVYAPVQDVPSALSGAPAASTVRSWYCAHTLLARCDRAVSYKCMHTCNVTLCVWRSSDSSFALWGQNHSQCVVVVDHDVNVLAKRVTGTSLSLAAFGMVPIVQLATGGTAAAEEVGAWICTLRRSLGVVAVDDGVDPAGDSCTQSAIVVLFAIKQTSL